MDEDIKRKKDEEARIKLDNLRKKEEMKRLEMECVF